MEDNIQNIKKKDRWNLAYKNFLHISYVGGFVSVAALVFWLLKPELAKEYKVGVLVIATAFVMTGIWFYLAQLFKKRDKKAITFGYALLIILLIWNIIYSINIIMILIFGYLLYLVYRASKSEIIPPSVSSGV